MTTDRPDSDSQLVLRGLLLLEAELVTKLQFCTDPREIQLLEEEKRRARRLYRHLRKLP